MAGQTDIYFNSNKMFLKIGGGLHVFNLKIVEGEVLVEAEKEYPNLIERKCWWNRAVQINEPVRFKMISKD